MVAVVIGTHGKLSEEILKSSEMISGKQENIGYIKVEVEEGLSDLVSKYAEEINKLDTKDGVLFLVDFFGGSSYNAASMIAIKNKNIKNMDIVTGVNIKMILKIVKSMKFLNLEDLVNLALIAGGFSIRTFR